MTRKECLEQAMGCVLHDRQKQYGEPEDCFETIAMMWSAYLGKIIHGWDVAAMMALLKIARIKANPAHADNWCDLAGYAACGAECRQKFEAEMKKTVEDAFETFPHLKPKVEGCEEPEFKYGDRVQFRDEIPSTSEPHWFEGVYVERLSTGGHVVKFGPHGHVIHCSDKEIRPAPRAEGCEDLVFDETRMRESMPGIVPQDGPSDFDAPQTREALCQHIVDCNPATYGRPRKPTGEELAEMAEEDGNA